MRPRLHLSVLAGAALLVVGCASRTGPTGTILSLLGDLGVGLLLTSAVWTVGLGFLGFGLALLAFFSLRGMGAYRWERPLGRYFRGLTATTMAVVLPICFGVVGFFEGTLRATSRFLAENELVTRHYPALGSVGADLLGFAYFQPVSSSEALGRGAAAVDLSPWLARLRSGELQMEVADFDRRLAQAGEETLQIGVEAIRADAKQRFAALASGRGERLLDGFLDLFGKALVRRSLTSRLEKVGAFDFAGRLYRRFLATLPEAAAREGDPRRLSHRELASHLAQTPLAGGTIHVLRSLIRAQQLAPALLALVALAGPVGFFQVASRVWPPRGGRAAGAPAAGSPEPPALAHPRFTTVAGAPRGVVHFVVSTRLRSLP